MKVSLNWVKQFTDIAIPVEELVEKIGSQLGAVEEVVDLSKKYEGILVAKVVSCEKHPNADKLSVCWVDDGGKTQDVERNEHGLVQVVCGASNVREGLLVAWLPPGSTVPSTFDKDPFVLSARELRGIVSNGMLASSSELAISDDHDGIVEIDIDAVPGSLFADVYQLNDIVIDIENKMFTHRPDCFGILGVAREIAGIQHQQFTSPDWYRQSLGRIKPGKTRIDLTVRNELDALVPRFTAITMADVVVGPSPLTLQTTLSRVGLRPINNIVDITNYLMYLTGQPLHAYDADKLQKYGELSLETRMSRKGETIKLLNGKDLELFDESSILITSNDVPVGIAGVMGGADTEVDSTTKNIVIECANFDMYSVRRTSMKYGLFTDAVTRFNKGQSRLQNERVMEEAVALMQSVARGHVAGDLIDIHVNVHEHESLHVDPEFINSRLGVTLTGDDIRQLLTNVEFVLQERGNSLEITPPFWRTDIAIAEDIVEEVGRLYGYDRLPLVLPERDLAPVQTNKDLDVKTAIRRCLSTAGANEVLTYSFVHGNLLMRAGQDPNQAFKLGNAISPDLQYFRLSITPSLLEKVHPNIKAGYDEFALFEIGKVHGKSDMEESLPKEFDRVALVVARNDKDAKSKRSGAPYYMAKQYIEALFQHKAPRFVPLSESDFSSHVMFAQLQAPFEPKRSALVYYGDKLAGVVGEYTQDVSENLKLPQYCAGFELFLSTLHEGIIPAPYIPTSRYPKVEQDITLRTPRGMNFDALFSAVQENLFLPEHSSFSIKALDIFIKDPSDDYKHVTLRVTVSNYARTLTAEEVNESLDNVAAMLGESHNISRV
jgi:phenylalanyl-tRNA synthetase beta chain